MFLYKFGGKNTLSKIESPHFQLGRVGVSRANVWQNYFLSVPTVQGFLHYDPLYPREIFYCKGWGKEQSFDLQFAPSSQMVLICFPHNMAQGFIIFSFYSRTDKMERLKSLDIDLLLKIS